MTNSTMKFINEAVIDKTVEHLEAASDQKAMIEQLGDNQPAILAYLTSESFQFFSPEERSFLFFMVLVITQSIEKEIPELPLLTQEQIGASEEQNWELFEASKARNFRDKLNVFFENYPQEDLLAFVEDALETDEDSGITEDGRAHLFISVKSIIDGFIRAI